MPRQYRSYYPGCAELVEDEGDVDARLPDATHLKDLTTDRQIKMITKSQVLMIHCTAVFFWLLRHVLVITLHIAEGRVQAEGVVLRG